MYVQIKDPRAEWQTDGPSSSEFRHVFQHKHFFFRDLLPALKIKIFYIKIQILLKKNQKILATLSSISARQQSVKTELWLLLQLMLTTTL